MANTISVSVLADVRDINRKLGDVNNRLGGFGKATKRIGGLIAGAFAGGAAIQGIKTMVTSASDLNETISKTETIFGKSSPSILKWGDNAAKALGLSKQEALDGVSTFGNFFNQIGFGTKETEKMSKSLVQASVDMGSFHNAAPTEVMEALSAATRGEYDSLQKYIPTINAAAVEQEALAQTGKKVASELTNQEKAAATYSLVMKGQGKAAGDYARTQGSLANQLKQAKAQIANVVAEMGMRLLPIATKAVTLFNDNFLPALKKIGSFIKGTVVPALKDLGNFLRENSDYLIALGAGLAAAKVALVAYNAYVRITTAVTKAWAVVQKVLNGTMRANPVGLVITAIALLVGALVLAYKKSETFRKVVNKAWAGIKKAASVIFPVVKKVITTTFNVIKKIVSTSVKVMSKVIKTTWNVIKTVTRTAWNLIKNTILVPIRVVISLLRGNTGKAKSIMKGAWDYIKNATGRAWDGIKNAVSKAVSKVVETVRNIKGKVTGALSSAGSWLVGAGKDVMRGLWNGIASMAGWLKSAVINLVSDILPGPVKKVLGIASPSKVFAEIGRFTTEGLALGLKDTRAIGKVRQAAGSMTTAIGDGFERPSLALSTTGGGSAVGGNHYSITITADASRDPSVVRRLKAAIDDLERTGARKRA